MIFIFSDESGDVYDPNVQYYVRSFIFIEEKSYHTLKTKFSTLRREYNIEGEIKFRNFKNVPERYEDIFHVPFYAFICFTDVSRNFLKRDNEYRLIKDLKEVLVEHRKEHLEKRLSDTVRSEFWLDYFEKYYIQSSKNVLDNFFPNHDNQFKYFIDEPKFLVKSYKRMLQQNGVLPGLYEIVDSKDCEGVQLADIFAGSIHDLLDSDIKEKPNKRFFPLVRSKLVTNSCVSEREYRPFPNPYAYPTKGHLEYLHYYNVLLETRFLYLKDI